MGNVTEKCIVSTWVHRDVRTQLERLASEGDRSLSAQVRRAVQEHLEERSAEPSPRQLAVR